MRGGDALVRLTRGDHFLTTAEAARLAGVSPSRFRSWRSLGYIQPQGLDEHGRPLHTATAVREAERQVRERGLATTKTDPRRLRASARALAAGLT